MLYAFQLMSDDHQRFLPTGGDDDLRGFDLPGDLRTHMAYYFVESTAAARLPFLHPWSAEVGDSNRHSDRICV